jgi:hypothetical protein
MERSDFVFEGKICTKCNEYKSLNEYHKATGRTFGVKSACKQCTKPIKQNHYQNNKEKYKQAFKDFTLRNPECWKLYERN